MISSVACFVRGSIEGEVSLTGANVTSKTNITRILRHCNNHAAGLCPTST